MLVDDCVDFQSSIAMAYRVNVDQANLRAGSITVITTTDFGAASSDF